MQASELRQKSTDELLSISKEYRRNLFDLRFKQHTGQLTQTSELRAMRRDIARVETILRERQIAQQAGGRKGGR
jgi:large subunit ribosomal protein L29